jgi:hypothetical protein
MQRREHIRIRKPRPSSSAVILMLLLGADEKSNPKRPRRNVVPKAEAASAHAAGRGQR